MPHDFTPEGFVERVEKLVEERFQGKVAGLIRKCQEVHGDMTANAVYSMINRRSFIRIDIAAAIAVAAGVSLDWLAGIEKPRQGGSAVADLVNEAKGHNPRSVQFEPLPPDYTVLPGFAIGAPGSEQLVVDFLVKGQESRHTIPFQEHRTKGDKQT